MMTLARWIRDITVADYIPNMRFKELGHFLQRRNLLLGDAWGLKLDADLDAWSFLHVSTSVPTSVDECLYLCSIQSHARIITIP